MRTKRTIAVAAIPNPQEHKNQQEMADKVRETGRKMENAKRGGDDARAEKILEN